MNKEQQMHNQQLNEGLRSNDLKDMVHSVLTIDTHRSKMGEDRDVCVLSFTVNDRNPAKDLMEFIEKGYDFVLDADVSSGENTNGEYSVFVELSRTKDLAEQIKVLAPGSAIEADAQRVIDDIVRDPELLKQVVEAQSDRLATLLLQAAESCLMQGQPQQAVYFLERVMQAFPTTRHAMTAQTRLAQIQ
jgi:hypothetical protein